MNNILIIIANLMISLYLPYEMCRLIIRQYEREAERRRIGLGSQDGVLSAFQSRWIVRGAKVIAEIRKTISGLLFASFLFGIVIGFLGGYGWAIFFWFTEVLFMGIIVDVLGRFRRKDDIWAVGS